MQFHIIVIAFKAAHDCVLYKWKLLIQQLLLTGRIYKFSISQKYNAIASLAQELPAYLAAADGVLMANKSDFPQWHTFKLGSTGQEAFCIFNQALHLQREP